MKRLLLFSVFAMCFFLNSTAQKKVQKLNAPREDVKVNREYDENGNLIKFDSIHTYNWSGDTSLVKSLSPQDLSNLFGNHFGFLSDSTFRDKSFFDHFDQLFDQPFSGTQDSLLMKKFGIYPHYPNFQLNPDSLVWNLKDFDSFFNFGENKKDSILSKSRKPPLLHSQSRSMDEMMKMLQHQMQEMEKQHKEFFKEEPKWKEF